MPESAEGHRQRSDPDGDRLREGAPETGQANDRCKAGMNRVHIPNSAIIDDEING